MRIFLFFLAISISSISFSQINTFPYTQDFESFSNCSGTCSGPCNLSAGWSNATNDGAEWFVDFGGTSSLNTGPSQDHNPGTSSGNYLYTETSGCNNQTALLNSPTFDFSLLSNPTIDFWWHMFGTAMGTMHFDLDTGTGVWIQDVIPSWTANLNQWQNTQINLTNLAAFNPNVKFRIRGMTGTSFTSDMAIDDFRIFNDIPDDLAITEVVSPKQDCGVTGVLPIEIEITNLGASDQNNFSLAYQINDNPPVIQQYIGLLASDQKDNFVFQSSFDFTPLQDFKIKTWVIFPQDLNKANDTLSEGVKEAFPLEVVDFSNYNGDNLVNAFPGWREARGNNAPGASLNANWKSSDSLQQLFFGTPTAKINLSGTQNSEWIVSPPVLISNSARLFFSVALTTKDGTQSANMGSDDELEVYISTDCGNTFSILTTIDAFTTLSNSLRQFAINLISYVGQDVVFAFKAKDGPVNDPEDYDLHITLIEARRVFPNDVGIIDFRTQNGDKIIAANTGENIFIRLKNFGSNTVSNIPIVSKVGVVNYQNVFSGNLASNAETEINIGAYFGDPNGSPFISVKSFTLFSNDTINSNDTLNAVLNVDGATELQDLLEKEISIRPNPFSDHFTLDLGTFSGTVKLIKVFDLNGKEIHSVHWNGDKLFNFESNSLSSGLYILNLEGENFVHRLKCIKE